MSLLDVCKLLILVPKLSQYLKIRQSNNKQSSKNDSISIETEYNGQNYFVSTEPDLVDLSLPDLLMAMISERSSEHTYDSNLSDQ